MGEFASPAEELDLDGLEDRAKSLVDFRTELRDALSFGKAMQTMNSIAGEGHNDDSCDVAIFLDGSVDQIRDAMARLGSHWESEVLKEMPQNPLEVCQCIEDLRELYELHAAARAAAQVCAERKEAATMALNAAALEQLEEDEEGDGMEDHTPSSKDLEKHKHKKGWGKKIIRKFGGSKSKTKEAASSSGCANSPATMSVSKNSDDRVQLANEELVEAAEALQSAMEQVDRWKRECVSFTQNLLSGFALQEAAYTKKHRIAVREATVAIENWAGEAWIAVAPNKGESCASPIGPSAASTRESSGEDEASDAEDHDDENNLFARPSTRTPCSPIVAANAARRAVEGVGSVPEQSLELRVGNAAKESEAAWQALLCRRPGRSLPKPREGMLALDLGPSSPRELAAANEQLERRLRMSRPRHLGRRMRCRLAELTSEVETLECVARACASAAAAAQDSARANALVDFHTSAPSSSSSKSAGDVSPTPTDASSAGKHELAAGLCHFRVGEHYVGNSNLIARTQESPESASKHEIPKGVTMRIVEVGQERPCHVRVSVQQSIDQQREVEGWISALTRQGEVVLSKVDQISFAPLPVPASRSEQHTPVPVQKAPSSKHKRSPPHLQLPVETPDFSHGSPTHGARSPAFGGFPRTDTKGGSFQQLLVASTNGLRQNEPAQGAPQRDTSSVLGQGYETETQVESDNNAGNPFADELDSATSPSMTAAPGGSSDSDAVASTTPVARARAPSLRSTGRPSQPPGLLHGFGDAGPAKCVRLEEEETERPPHGQNPFDDDRGNPFEEDLSPQAGNPFDGDEEARPSEEEEGANPFDHEDEEGANPFDHDDSQSESDADEDCDAPEDDIPGGSPCTGAAKLSRPPAHSTVSFAASKFIGKSPFSDDADSDGCSHVGDEAPPYDSAVSFQAASPSQLPLHPAIAEDTLPSSPWVGEDPSPSPPEVSEPSGSLPASPRPCISRRPDFLRKAVTSCASAGLATCIKAIASTMASWEKERSTRLDEELEKAFRMPCLDVALGKSDASLAHGRLGDGPTWRTWEWRDFAAEESHVELQRCTHSIATAMSDEDWGHCAYETMLLAHANLMEKDEDDSLLSHIRAVLPMCRISLGITNALHHHIAELTLPDGVQDYTNFLDVRYRAAVLFRSWARAECAGLGGLLGNCGGGKAEWTTAWVRRQLHILRGNVIVRALNEGREVAGAIASTCLERLRYLDSLAANGRWGQPDPVTAEEVDESHMVEGTGRRLLAALLRDLDALRPRHDLWRLDTISTAKIFSKLWVAAIDDTTEDRVSLDAPAVATALLNGVHPYVGAVPLGIETHALLLTQQLWGSLSEGKTNSGSHTPALMQIPCHAVQTTETLLDDFTSWLQEHDVSTASCFARSESFQESPAEEAMELVARRLLLVDLRDGLIQTLSNYRRHFEPDAFPAVLNILWRSQMATARTKQLIESSAGESMDDLPPDGSGTLSNVTVHKSTRDVVEQSQEFVRRMGQWIVWQSVQKTADRALGDFDNPPEVDAGSWEQKGSRVKKHLEGLAASLKMLQDEYDCERSFYNDAFQQHGLGPDHLGVAADALCEATRRRVKAMIESGAWPTREKWPTKKVLEVPPGGGRLLQALEALDRLAARSPPPRTTPNPLVDLLARHVFVALEDSFTALDREITSHVLDDSDKSDDVVFKPLKQPKMIHCEGVVTFFRFVHDALDAPLNLGVSVDLVVQPFLKYLTEALDRVMKRLVRDYERRERFKLLAKATQMSKDLSNSEFVMESDDEDGAVSGGEDLEKKKKKKRSLRLFRSKSDIPTNPDKNEFTYAALLDTELQSTAIPILQVGVRISSVGFCLEETGLIYSQLLQEVNKGDDSDVPTKRHNDARRLICEELPDLRDTLQENGIVLAKYLAARIVYHELKVELFERLYFDPAAKPIPLARGSLSPRASLASSYHDDGSFVCPDSLVPSCLTLEAVLRRKEEGFLGLVRQMPLPFLLDFVFELCSQLCNAWTCVVVDYMRRGRLDQVVAYLDDDQEALKYMIERLMKEARGKFTEVKALSVATGGPQLQGVSLEECGIYEKRLEEAQKGAQMLILKAHSCTSAEEIARYCERISGDAPAPEQRGDGDGVRSTTPRGACAASHSDRSASPAPGAARRRSGREDETDGQQGSKKQSFFGRGRTSTRTPSQDIATPRGSSPSQGAFHVPTSGAAMNQNHSVSLQSDGGTSAVETPRIGESSAGGVTTEKKKKSMWRAVKKYTIGSSSSSSKDARAKPS